LEKVLAVLNELTYGVDGTSTPITLDRIHWTKNVMQQQVQNLISLYWSREMFDLINLD